MNTIHNAIAYLREHELLSALILWFCSFVFTSLFNPKTPEERESLRKRYPKWSIIVDFTSGLGADAAKLQALVERVLTKRGS